MEVAVPRDVSLDDLLQDLAEESGHRLVLLDTALRVVGYSIHETEADRIRLGHVLAHSDSWPRPAIPSDGYATVPLPQLGSALFLSVADVDRPMGYLMVAPADTDPVPAVRDRLRAATAELGRQLLVRDFRQESRRTRAAELVGHLLGSNARHRTRAARSLIEEGLLGAATQYAAVAVGQDPATLNGAENTHGVSLILDFVTRSSTASVVGGAHEGVGVLVFPRPVVVERLARLLGPGLRAGIGPLVPALEDLPHSFARARAAWRAAYLGADRHPTVLTWDAAGIDGVLAMLPLETLGVGDLPTPVRRLWDTGPDEVLVETLQTYLDRGGDARATARRLSIHRSTFYYRLDRLRSVLQVDLADGAVRRELDTGLRLARLAGLSARAG
ncbi:PucR family transcriptional regulator [Enemella evansiae]|nr:PucR family transcriptional regulator [Enemella evansiae]